MIKLTGLILILLTCVSLGVLKASSLGDRVKKLRVLSEFINWIGNEIEYTLKPLDALTEELKTHTLFRECDLINNLETDSISKYGFACVWNKAISEYRRPLKNEDVEILSRFGAALGKGEQDAQVSLCRYANSQLYKQIESAEKDSNRLGKLYITLGALGGAFAVIILL